MGQRGSNKKVANGLVAASCAAVLAVYTAGYTRTRSAAERLDARAIERRTAVPGPQAAAAQIAEARSPVPNQPRERASAEPKPTVTRVPEAAVVPSSPVPLVVTPVTPSATPTPAPAVPVAEVKPEVPPKPWAAPWKDGSYLGWGSSRHGDIQAEVVIADGRITSATIAQCKTMYSCYVIEILPPQVGKRQSPEVDNISGASESADAFYWAVTDALTKAK